MSLVPIDRTIDRIIKLIAGDKYKEFIDIYRNWKPVVGALLAEKSHPIKYENSVIYVLVSNNVWLQELVLMKSKIKQDLKSKLKTKINDIVFFIRTPE